MSLHVQPVQSLRLTTAWLAALLLPVWTCATERAADASAGSNPLGGGGSVVLERVPEPPVSSRPQRVVFTCVAPGLITFSDRPCGPLPERRELQLLPATVTRSGEAASVTPPQARASTRPAAVAGRDETQAARRDAGREGSCQPLQDTVTTIDRQMRAGYSAREAPRLWERWRDAKDRLRAAGCR